MAGSNRLRRAALRVLALAIRTARALGLKARWSLPTPANRRVGRSGLFDAQAYLQTYPHAGWSVLSPLDHFMAHGAAAGHDPNPYFSTLWYLANNPDVARAGLNPLVHYIDVGEGEGRAPSRAFDPIFYASRYPEIAGCGVGPLAHFLTLGRAEGRLPRAPTPERLDAASGEPPLATVAPLGLAPGRPAALLAVSAPDGRLGDKARGDMEALHATGRQVVVIVTTEAKALAEPAPVPLAGLYSRRPGGTAFVAFARALAREPDLYAAGSLLLLDGEEPAPPPYDGLAQAAARLDGLDADIAGLEDSYEGEWRLCGAALRLGPRALGSVALQRFMLNLADGGPAAGEPGAAVRGFSSDMRAAGLSVEALAPSVGPPPRPARAMPRGVAGEPPFAAPPPAVRFAQVAWRVDQRHADPAVATPLDIAPDPKVWLILAPPEAFAHPRAPELVAEAAEGQPGADLLYADSALLTPGERPSPRLTPAFDRVQLMAQDYLGPALAVRGSVFHALGGLRPEAGRPRLYDLALRAAVAGHGLGRIPEVLSASPAREATAPLDERRRVLARVLRGADPSLHVIEGRAPGTLGVARVWEVPPSVTLIVPTMQGGVARRRPHIAALLESLTRTDWPMDRLCVLVGDDAADDHLYRSRPWPFALRRIDTARATGERFNYAAKMNRLWPLAESEHLVLLNDDVSVRDPAWLKALMTFAVEPDVGAVGARLLFPDGRLQHAGVIAGLFGLCAHPWFGQLAERPTYQNWALIQREWSVVTAAVLATRRSVLERLDGFDEAFSLDFNDVDLCLRMRRAGLRVVYTPYAELTHHEKASRGDHPALAAEQALFLRRWRATLDADPSYHPAMSRDSYDPAPVVAPGAWWTRL